MCSSASVTTALDPDCSAKHKKEETGEGGDGYASELLRMLFCEDDEEDGMDGEGEEEGTASGSKN